MRRYFRKAYGLSLFLLIIVVSVVFSVFIYRLFHPPIPHSFDPGIRLGAGLFKKTLFFEDDRLDYVTDIEFGRLRPDRDLEYCIAGNMGAAFLDKNTLLVEFKILKNIRYPLTNHRIVIDENGQCIFWVRKFEGDLHFPLDTFVLNGEELPFVHKHHSWIVAEGTSNEIRFPLPFFNDIRGTSVYFGNDKTLYYAVLGKSALQAPFAGYKLLRLNLFIFDSKCQLIYSEVLEDDATIDCTAIKAVTLAGSKGQFLLVGGTSRVLQYTLANKNTTPTK